MQNSFPRCYSIFNRCTTFELGCLKKGIEFTNKNVFYIFCSKIDFIRIMYCWVIWVAFSVVFICVRSVQVWDGMSQRQQTMCFSSRLHSSPGNFLLPLTFVIFIITFVKLYLPQKLLVQTIQIQKDRQGPWLGLTRFYFVTMQVRQACSSHCNLNYSRIGGRQCYLMLVCSRCHPLISTKSLLTSKWVVCKCAVGKCHQAASSKQANIEVAQWQMQAEARQGKGGDKCKERQGKGAEARARQGRDKGVVPCWGKLSTTKPSSCHRERGSFHEQYMWEFSWKLEPKLDPCLDEAQ